jgi:hypothetical protein
MSAADPPSLSHLHSNAAAPMSVRLKRTALATALFALLGALLYAKAIPCMFARLFHTPCPGCGSTRAVLALLDGDLAGVLHYNPVGPIAAFLIGLLALQVLVSVARHGDARDAGAGLFGRSLKRALGALLVIQILVWVARFFGALGGPVPV